MAVVPMKRLELFALRRDRKAILELLQRRGVVEVESTQASGEVFRQADTSQAQQELETQARLLEQAVGSTSARGRRPPPCWSRPGKSCGWGNR